jgi:prevent-host-death family protein
MAPKHTSTVKTAFDTTKPVTIHNAKTHLSRLVAAAEAGEEVVIARGAKPVVRLVPMTAVAPPKSPRKRVFGAFKGLITIDDRFFEPLPDDELARWEGK